MPNPNDDGIRLQKVLAQAGFGSRRKAEELIAAGRVTVNQKVAELGARVDPDTDAIAVDGERIVVTDNQIILAINKPPGMLSSLSDPHGRPTISDLITDRNEHLFHVGRLDADTEGLLLVTNDGELANRLAHPSFEIPKRYIATVQGPMYPRLVKELLTGVELEDGLARADKVQVKQQLGEQTLVEIELHSGRNRIVRRMFDAIGRPVQKLVRTQIGPIRIGSQRPGTVRELTRKEHGALLTGVGL